MSRDQRKEASSREGVHRAVARNRRRQYLPVLQYGKDKRDPGNRDQKPLRTGLYHG